MLSKTMQKRLNEQIQVEHASANLYLQMSAWCLARGLEGCGTFFRAHSQEEMGHMYKLFDYVNETGAQAMISEIEAPRGDFGAVADVFKLTLEHEQFVTKAITSLVDAALEEKDFSTFNFLQWYISEQHEEEALFKGILDKVELIGSEGPGLFHLDREIGSMRAEMIQQAPAEN